MKKLIALSITLLFTSAAYGEINCGNSPVDAYLQDLGLPNNYVMSGLEQQFCMDIAMLQEQSDLDSENYAELASEVSDLHEQIGILIRSLGKRDKTIRQLKRQVATAKRAK